MRPPSLNSLEPGPDLIRVAYDVSSIATFSDSPKAFTGVGRVIEEQLWYLRKNPALEMRVTGGFGGDWNPIITSVFAQRWAKTVPSPPIPFLRGYQTKSILGDMAVNELYALQERAAAQSSSSAAVARISRINLAVLRRLAHALVNWRIDEKVDLFHATFRAPPDWVPSRLPRVVTVHDVIPLRRPEECAKDIVGMTETLLASISPTRDVVVAVSDFTKQDFCSLSGFPSERVIVAHLSASARFRPLADPASGVSLRNRFKLGEAPFFLSAFNPAPHKNIPLLIRSFYRVVREHPAWRGNLVLVGNVRVGAAGTSIEQAIDSGGELSSRVLRVGSISDEDLAGLYATCDAFLFPSTYEGFGLPVLEAFQCGAPVICSNMSSVPEVAGDAAILIDPRDESALAAAMGSLVENPGRRAEYSEKGLRRAAEFSWEASARAVADAYRMAMRRPAAREEAARAS